jgi:hypothetical protein
MQTAVNGFVDSTSLLDDPEALRKRQAEDGYLFFRGLLPRDDVLGLRKQLMQVLDSYGWIDTDRGDLLDGYAHRDAVNAIPLEELEFCGTGVPRSAYQDAQRLQAFHALAHHPRLIALYEALFGSAVLVHPRNIARLMLPRAGTAATPPHQDYIHIQGTKNVRTCWIPIGDCPRELGGLSVLRGSHADGVLPVKAAQGAGGLETWLCNTGHEWLEDDFRAGDVLTFESRMVHRALPNQRDDVVRLSCDYRYQPAGDPIEPRSLKVHCDVLSWDDVYHGWTRDDLQYYWKEEQLLLAEWDESLRWQKEHICD